MDSVYDYARRWAKEEEVEVDTLSELVKLILSSVNKRISILCATMSTRCKSVVDNPEFAAELVDLHDNYVVVPADKTSNNIVFVCKTYYISCLREELGLNTSKGNPTCTCTSLSKEGTLAIHKTVLLSFGISTADKDLDLPELYWVPMLHKDPYKRYTAGSAKGSTMSLSLRFLQEPLRQLEMDFRNIVIHLTQEVA